MKRPPKFLPYDMNQQSGQVDTIVICKNIEKLYVDEIKNDSFTKDEQELAKAVHNDAISLVISQLKGDLVNDLS